MPLLSTFGAASARSFGGIGGASGGAKGWVADIGSMYINGVAVDGNDNILLYGGDSSSGGDSYLANISADGTQFSTKKAYSGGNDYPEYNGIFDSSNKFYNINDGLIERRSALGGGSPLTVDLSRNTNNSSNQNTFVAVDGSSNIYSLGRNTNNRALTVIKMNSSGTLQYSRALYPSGGSGSYNPSIMGGFFYNTDVYWYGYIPKNSTIYGTAGIVKCRGSDPVEGVAGRYYYNGFTNEQRMVSACVDSSGDIYFIVKLSSNTSGLTNSTGTVSIGKISSSLTGARIWEKGYYRTSGQLVEDGNGASIVEVDGKVYVYMGREKNSTTAELLILNSSDGSEVAKRSIQNFSTTGATYPVIYPYNQASKTSDNFAILVSMTKVIKINADILPDASTWIGGNIVFFGSSQLAAGANSYLSETGNSSSDFTNSDAGYSVGTNSNSQLSDPTITVSNHAEIG